MPVDTTNVAVPAATWTKVADGPTQAQMTGSDNFEYLYAPTVTPPGASMRGHFVFAARQEIAAPLAEQSVYVMNPTRAFTLALTEAG